MTETVAMGRTIVPTVLPGKRKLISVHKRLIFGTSTQSVGRKSIVPPRLPLKQGGPISKSLGAATWR